MEDKKDILYRLACILGILVFVIPITIYLIIPNIFLPLKARFSFLFYYDCWYRNAPEFAETAPKKDYYTTKDRNVKFRVKLDKDELDWGDDYADYYYGKEYISFVKGITDKYYDDALVIDNFSVTETHFYWHKSMDVGTFEDYCKVGIRHPMWIYLSQGDDLAKVDEMIGDIKNSITCQNLSVVVMQVPDNIYELNKDIDIYTDEDGLEDEFIKTVGTADFRTYKYNDYIVAQWNYAAYGESSDYLQTGVYKGYVVDIIEKPNSYGYSHYYAHVASTPDGTDYVSVYAFKEDEISVGDEVYVGGCPVYDFDENKVVTDVCIQARAEHPTISDYNDTPELQVQSVQVLLDEVGKEIKQPVYKVSGKLIYANNEYRLYTDYINSRHYYSLRLSDLQDKDDMLSHVNETVCIEGIYMFDYREDNYIFSARLVED